MKFFVALCVAVLAASSSAIPLRSGDDPDGWYVPTVDGKFFWMTKKQFENEFNVKERKAVNVEYYLYTKSNPTSPQQLTLHDTDRLSSSNFNKANPTRFIIHGWQNHHDSEVNLEIRSALLKSGDFNIISVDWSSAAATINYASSKLAVPKVGKNVAAFLDFLNVKAGMSFESLTLVGHSLGAHICGYAGKLVTKGTVNMITGLDPALPLFSYKDCKTRLCTTDAKFVDSIQTNGNLLGFLEPIGTAAYYPNGGKSQPGCGLDLAGSCAHSRSFLYYAEALVQNNFVTLKCKDYEAAVAKKCENSYQKSLKSGFGSVFNEGSYYVPVNKKSLYAKV